MGLLMQEFESLPLRLFYARNDQFCGFGVDSHRPRNRRCTTFRTTFSRIKPSAAGAEGLNEIAGRLLGGMVLAIVTEGGLEDCSNLSGRFFLHGRQDMGVGVQGDADRSMPKALLDDLWMDSDFEQPRCVCVA